MNFHQERAFIGLFLHKFKQNTENPRRIVFDICKGLYKGLQMQKSKEAFEYHFEASLSVKLSKVELMGSR